MALWPRITISIEQAYEALPSASKYWRKVGVCPRPELPLAPKRLAPEIFVDDIGERNTANRPALVADR